MKRILLIVGVLFFSLSLLGEEIIKVGLSDGEIITGRLKASSEKRQYPLTDYFRTWDWS